MRSRQAMASLGNPEIAIMRIAAQTIGFEILVTVMADGDALLWTGALGGSLRASFRLDRFSRGRFGAGLSSGLGGCFACRRFFLRGGAACWPRCRLLLGH